MLISSKLLLWWDGLGCFSATGCFFKSYSLMSCFMLKLHVVATLCRGVAANFGVQSIVKWKIVVQWLHGMFDSVPKAWLALWA